MQAKLEFLPRYSDRVISKLTADGITKANYTTALAMKCLSNCVASKLLTAILLENEIYIVSDLPASELFETPLRKFE